MQKGKDPTPPARLAHYYFDPGKPRVTIHLPVDPAQPVAAEDLGLWVAQIMDSTHALTHAYALAGNEGVHLFAGADLQWRRALVETPAAPVLIPRLASTAVTSWHTEQTERAAAERAQLEARLARPEAPSPKQPRTCKQPPPGQVDREMAILYNYLLAQGREMRPTEILQAGPPGVPRAQNTLSNRLMRLLKQGKATRRPAGYEAGAGGRVVYWQAVPPTAPPPERVIRWRDGLESTPLPAPAQPAGPEAEVVAWTRGKVMLFWGGRPPGSVTKEARTRELEARLQLKECRWVYGGDHGDHPQNLREIERADVDFMVVTLFNPHHITEQLARRAI
jgi:hypothetical protein